MSGRMETKPKLCFHIEFDLLLGGGDEQSPVDTYGRGAVTMHDVDFTSDFIADW